MEPLLETIDLDMEESNELLFKVQIQGADPAPAKVRMICEGGELGFVFNGKAGPEGLVQFNLPVMKDRLREGVYQARVEVLIENRYFAPVQFQVNFKRTVKVVAESVTLSPRKAALEIKVTAAPVIQKKPDVPVVTPVPAPTPVREAPPLARHNSQVTLKERFQTKQTNVETDELDEDAILAAAKSFVANRKRR